MNKTLLIVLVVGAIAAIGFMVVSKKSSGVSTNPTVPSVGIPRQTNLGVVMGAVDDLGKAAIAAVSSAWTKQATMNDNVEYQSTTSGQGWSDDSILG